MMRKLLLFIATLILPSLAIGQTTPNLGFNIPASNTPNWGTLLNQNFSLLDSLLSGTSPLPSLSVSGALQAPQLTTWVSSTSYADGELVFFLGTVYQSLSASNQGNMPVAGSAFWTTNIAGGSGGSVTFPTGVLFGNNSTASPTVATTTQLQAAIGAGVYDASGAAVTAQNNAEGFASSALAGAINPSSVGATTPGPIAATTLHATGQITSTVSTGTAPLVVASTTQVANLNAATAGAAGSLSGASALPNGTTATTQTAGDNTTKVATDAFVLANAGSGGSATLGANTFTGTQTAPAVATNGSGAGTYAQSNAAGTATTTWTAGATTSNTIAGFATAPVSGDLLDCITTGTVCQLTDAGIPASSVTTASNTQTFTNKSISFGQVTGTPSTTQVPVQSLTTLGSGAATLSAGVLNVPTPSGSGGSLPSSTNGQTFASSGTTPVATSQVLVGGTTGAGGIGIGGVEVDSTMYVDTFEPTGAAVFSGSCAAATTTSCAITGGAALDPLGGVVWAGVGEGGNDGEFIHYSAATSTSITFATAGRGVWGSTAATHGNGEDLFLVTQAQVSSATTAPYIVTLQNGATFIGGVTANSTNAIGSFPVLATQNAFFTLSGEIGFSGKGNGKDFINFTSAAFNFTNDDANATMALGGNALQYSIATQAITATTLTAITNAKTPTMPANGTAAAAGTGGVLHSNCKIIWNLASGGTTVQFGVVASAAPTDLFILEQDSPGAYLAPTYTTITSTTATATSPAITPTSLGTTYASDFWITLNPGTTNAISVQLEALTSNGTAVTAEPGTGCSAWQ
jgi:hypothetical protein